MPRRSITKPAPAAKKNITIETPVGWVTLDRAGDRKTAYLILQEEEFPFPEPYASDPDVPVGPSLSGMAGGIVRALASRAAFVWEVAGDLRLRTTDDGVQKRLVKTPELDRAVGQLAGALMAQVDAETVLRLFEAETEDLRQAIIWGAGNVRLHMHTRREADRREYLGALAPLGGLSLSAILPALGYVEARPALPADPPDHFIAPEQAHGRFRHTAYQYGSAWVRAAYRAANPLVESIALLQDIPAIVEAPTDLPLLGLMHEGVDGVDPELGYAFVCNLRLEADRTSVAMVDLVLPFYEASVATSLPEDLLEEIRRAERRNGRPIQRIVPRARGEIATLEDEDRTLARTVAADLADSPEHPLSPERFAVYPTYPEYDRKYSVVRGRSAPGEDTLPIWLRPAFDDASYAGAVLQYLQRDVDVAEHPLLEQAQALVEQARTTVLPMLSQVVKGGAEAVRPAQDALAHALDLLARLRPEDLTQMGVATAPRPSPVPTRLVVGALSWWPLARPQEGSWEAALLVFALNRDHEVIPVPPALVAEILADPSPMTLPPAWEWRVDVFRFVAVAVARRTPGGPHHLGAMVQVAGLDTRHGRQVVVLVEDGEWHKLAEAVTDRLRVTGGDLERTARHLKLSAVPSETLPDAGDPGIAPELSGWLSDDVENTAIQIILERGPVRDIERETHRFRERAPRLAQELRRWSRLHPVIGGHFSLATEEVERYREFHQEPLVSVPEDVLPRADTLLDLELLDRDVVLLYAEPALTTAEITGAECFRVVWLREHGGELRLEHGTAEVAQRVVVRMGGVAAPAARGERVDVDWGWGGNQTKLVAARLPRELGPAPTDLVELFRRILPRTGNRGGQIASFGVSEATVLEAFREGETYTRAARVLASWGVKMSSGTLSTHVRRIREANPHLYTEIVIDS